MRETCFCGRSGAVEGREPVYVGDGEWALVCHACGHLDGLGCLTPAARREILVEAIRRHAARRPTGVVRHLPGALASRRGG
ncbi:MAG TPA: hypothetical protein VFL91_11135 [Thermomicrobiales bacterium]|nr:hypothetical protein [Thermomicrobiales bacterium]